MIILLGFLWQSWPLVQKEILALALNFRDTDTLKESMGSKTTHPRQNCPRAQIFVFPMACIARIEVHFCFAV